MNWLTRLIQRIRDWIAPKPATPIPAPTKKVTYLSPTTKQTVTLRQSKMTPEDWDKAMQQIAGLDTAVWVEEE